MGTGASTQANLMVSPREELARKTAQKIGDEKVGNSVYDAKLKEFLSQCY